MTTAQPMNFDSPDNGEETARADLYGVLAELFYEPPSQAILDTVAASRAEGEGVLERAWNELAAACRETKPDAVRDEYEQLFIGVGKPEIMLYGSYYLSGFLMEKPLAALRTDLAALGLQRAEAVAESEDHVATLCEVMRYLITSDEVEIANLASQKKFFAAHMQPWVGDLCTAIDNHPHAAFYKYVSRLARSFFEVEMQAFDMA
jgi:TorA maturation chaperone TorD